MGGKQSCPECIQNQTDPEIVRIIKFLVSSYIFTIGDRSLRNSVPGCNRGTLGNINFCDTLQFLMPNPVTCTLQFNIQNMKGLETATLSDMAWQVSRDTGNIFITMEVSFDVLNCIMSITPLDENCGYTGKFTAQIFECPDTLCIIGTPETPPRVGITLNIGNTSQTEFSSPSIEDISVQIGDVNIECIASYTHTFEAIRSRFVSKLEQAAISEVERIVNGVIGSVNILDV